MRGEESEWRLLTRKEGKGLRIEGAGTIVGSLGELYVVCKRRERKGG